ILTLTVSMCYLSCKKDTPPEPPTSKDPRTYTWTVDTIAAPGSLQTSMRDIWGSSPTNVYVVGHNERGFGKMFHYDGHSWQMVRLVTAEGGLIRGPIDLAAIHGFAPNDIYAVGQWDSVDVFTGRMFHYSLIIHFDGHNWREIPSARGGILQAVGGAATSDLWAGGGFGPSLYHIRNQQTVLIGNDTLLLYIDFAGINPSNVIALAYKFSPLYDSTYHYSFHWDGNSWRLEDTFIETYGGPPHTFGGYSLWGDKPTGRIYSAGRGVFVKSFTGWEKILDSPSYDLLSIFGSSEQNIFTVGAGRIVFHYNGSDWKQLTELQSLTSSFYYSGIWTDGVEAFIVGHGAGKSYVLHGK
ncbi:MAG: hypothetical protein AAB393_11150, partial [Bacteroidota bacterium]